MRIHIALRLLVLAAVLALGAAPAAAANIVMVNNDGPNEGFNDPSTPAPTWGCPAGMTLGECRVNAFQAAADRWGELLVSSLEIRVVAQFDSMGCTGAVPLGGCATNTIHRDFPNAPFAQTWYPSSLASALAGYDVNGGAIDMIAMFNSDLDLASCTLNWWYGTDGDFPGNWATNPDPNATHFFAVLLHEMAHGLGFSSLINVSNGQFPEGYPTVYSRFVYDASTGLHWDEMTAPQRVASAINTGNVVLDGPQNKIASDAFLTGYHVNLEVNEGGAAGTYPGYGALFGASWTGTDGVTLDMEVVNDGAGGSTSDGCEPLVGFTAGRIAFIDRGTCQFGLKALHAEQAGADGVVIADNQVSTDPFHMAPGEVGRQVTIPVQYTTQANANIIRPTLPANVTFDVIDVRGMHANGYVQLYTPNPVELGSSISHYDVLPLGPNPLLGPFINADLYDVPDMTLGMFLDEGWVIIGLLFSDGFESGDTTAWTATVP